MHIYIYYTYTYIFSKFIYLNGFLKRHKPPKIIQKELDSMNRPISIKENFS